MLGFRKYLQSLTEARISKVEDLLPLRTIRFFLVFDAHDDLGSMLPGRTEKERRGAAAMTVLMGWKNVKQDILKRLRSAGRYTGEIEVKSGYELKYRSLEDLWIVDVSEVSSEKEARKKLKDALGQDSSDIKNL